jgi:arginine/glutamate-rich protein 1
MGFSACTDLGYRRQQEAELKLIEEETARRVEEAIRKKVNEALNSEEVKNEIEAKVQEGRNKLFDEIAQQLAREKEDALAEARRQEVTTLNFVQLWLVFA